MKLIPLIVCVGAFSFAAPALGQTLALSSGGEEIWDLSAPEARHWHTGLTCWANAGEAPLKVRTAYNPTGSDVSCSYEGFNAVELVTLYATRRAPEETFASIVELTRAEVTTRYRGARALIDGSRTIQTSAGPLQIDELVFGVEGEDAQLSRHMRGATGVWHADVAGWTLKLRLSTYNPRGANALPALAEALIGRAYADMETARACAGAGEQTAPDLQVTDEESMTMQIGTTTLVHGIAGLLPHTPLAARQAGFVCLGDALSSPDGDALVGVMPAPTANAALQGDAVVLGLAEIRPAQGPARMVALIDMSINPFIVEGGRADRGQLIFEIANGRTDFYGVLDRGAVRNTLALIAHHVLQGSGPLISMSEPAAP